MEITLRSRGPVIRAEAAAGDPYAALDLAAEKLEARLRKQHDKRHTRRGERPDPAAEVADHVPDAATLNGNGARRPTRTSRTECPRRGWARWRCKGEGPLVVREKTHAAAPMTLDQALYEMELVGHDFYLFVDSETKQPSVVYRRHAYDYGVIHLSTDPMVTQAEPTGGGWRAGRLTIRSTTAQVPLVRVCAPRGTGVRPLCAPLCHLSAVRA